MRENFIQAGIKGKDERTYIDSDWFSHGIPSNVILSDNVYIDTSYGFAGFCSDEKQGLFIDEGSGCYDRASFIVSPTGKVSIGKFCILNGSTIICDRNIIIGSHCMLAWGSVITDTWIDSTSSIKSRKELMTGMARHPRRPYPMPGNARPVLLEDNCWIGFGAVILPGVTLGRGCIVGSKTIISADVPPYAIIVGDPPRIVKYLDPDDTEKAKEEAMSKYIYK